MAVPKELGSLFDKWWEEARDRSEKSAAAAFARIAENGCVWAHIDGRTLAHHAGKSDTRRMERSMLAELVLAGLLVRAPHGLELGVDTYVVKGGA